MNMLSNSPWFALTPSGLTGLVLWLLVVAFLLLLVQSHPHSSARRWMLAHIICLALFLTAHLLLITAFLIAWYPVEYVSFVAGMACLLQFVLTFPPPDSPRALTRWVRVLSAACPVGVMIPAFLFWFAPDNAHAVVLRNVAIGLGLTLTLAALLLLAYRTVELDTLSFRAQTRTLKFSRICAALLTPRQPSARALRAMLVIFIAILLLAASALAYRLWFHTLFSEMVFDIVWNLGLMALLVVFVLTYLGYSPDTISFQAKLIFGALTAVLTSIWLLALLYPFQMQMAYDAARQSDVVQVKQELLQNGSLRPETAPQPVQFVAACPAQDAAAILYRRSPEIDLARLCRSDFVLGSLYGKGPLDTRYSLYRFAQAEQSYLVGFWYADYIRWIDASTLPIAVVMLGSSLTLVLLLPLLLRRALIQPLHALLDGMQQVNRGRLDVTVPVTSNDEMGMLARSFNAMAGTLAASVTNLEQQIAASRQAEQTLRAQQKQLRALSARLVNVQEAERSRLGRELHDQAGQNLTALSLTLKLMRTELAAGEPDTGMVSQMTTRLDDASELVIQTTQRIRNVMDDLNPPALEEFGLAAALRGYVQRFTAHTGIPAGVSSSEPARRLAHPVELALFRIAQEALTNIARHAQAAQVWIKIEQTALLTRMVIGDNGVGMSLPLPDALPAAAHPTWGLRIMRERAESVGSTLQVDSAPDRGTQIIVEVTP